MYVPGSGAHVCDFEILDAREGDAGVEEISGLVLPQIMLEV